MKMLTNGAVRDTEEMEISGAGTVMVGVKLDSQSRELLTWALVKVAQPGDRVIALHVLDDNETVKRDGKSSLLSLVKAFDSILAVYEGFCNLKQVDLKLKICRGSSIRKIIVREAKAYIATKVIVGTAKNHHKIRSSTSVAKYLASKLSKDCCVLAVNNGKILFQREATPPTINNSQDHRKMGFLSVIHRSSSKKSKISNYETTDMDSKNKSVRQKMELALVNTSKQNCSMCEPISDSSYDTCSQSADEFSENGSEDNSLAIVPVQSMEVTSNSISLLIKELPELKAGWPLLHKSIFVNQQTVDKNKSSVKKDSVVQWAMRLPKRNTLCSIDLDLKQQESLKLEETQLYNLDEQSGAIVPVDFDYSLPKELEGLHEKYSSTCRLFKYHELVSATSNFGPENLIGKGGNSQVYRGCLPDGKELAIKILKSTEDAIKEFVLEIEIITTLHHQNVISLFGFCFEDNNLLLVYDFLARGTLEENLYGDKKDTRSFGWNERYKVAVGVADALDYLHSTSAQPVIHRDVKSSNILLHDDFEPRLSDFGLATWASISPSHVSCIDVAGTFGYMAPEYFMYGRVNEKIDVYAYGVVLLELLSGRKPISNEYPKGQESLVMWAKPILMGGKVSQLLDPSLGDNYDRNQMEMMVLAATLCIRRAPRVRPTMTLISKLLQGDPNVSKWARLQVNALEELDALDEDEVCPLSNLKSHLNLALLDVEDDSLSLSSIDQSVSLEDYLQGRWSRSSSFD